MRTISILVFTTILSSILSVGQLDALQKSVSSRRGPDEGPALKDEQRYGQCMMLTERAPDKAIDNALDWQENSGGVPARHCEAVALYFAGEFKEAAIRLEGLVEDMRVGRDMPVVGSSRLVASAELMADMFGQAANAWLLAGENSRAFDAIEAAIGLAPDNSPLELALLVDRARINAADEDFESALADLKQVQAFDTGRRDILIFVASAERALGRFDAASKNLELYQESFPDDPVGYLEKGHILDATGMKEAARKAYIHVIELAGENSPISDHARANIERLDVGEEE